MKKQALTRTEIETLAPGTSAAFDQWLQPVSEDDGVDRSEPKTRQRARLQWLIDTLALAGCAMAGVYVAAWLDTSDSDPNSVDREAKE
jgi:hypothetical protein